MGEAEQKLYKTINDNNDDVDDDDNDLSFSKYEIDAKTFQKKEMNRAAPPKVRLLRITPQAGGIGEDDATLLDVNLQRLIARLHQMNFFESFLITSEDVLRDIRQTLKVGKSERVEAEGGDVGRTRQQSPMKTEVAKNVFLVTTECRFRCNIYLVNPRPPDKADESAFEVKTGRGKRNGGYFQRFCFAGESHAIMR